MDRGWAEVPCGLEGGLQRDVNISIKNLTPVLFA